MGGVSISRVAPLPAAPEETGRSEECATEGSCGGEIKAPGRLCHAGNRGDNRRISNDQCQMTKEAPIPEIRMDREWPGGIAVFGFCHSFVIGNSALVIRFGCADRRTVLNAPLFRLISRVHRSCGPHWE